MRGTMHSLKFLTAVCILQIPNVNTSPLACYRHNAVLARKAPMTDTAALCPKHIAKPRASSSSADSVCLPVVHILRKRGRFINPADQQCQISTLGASKARSATFSTPGDESSSKNTLAIADISKSSPSSTSILSIGKRQITKASKILVSANDMPTKEIAAFRHVIPHTKGRKRLSKRGIVYDHMSSDYSKYFVGSKKVTFGSNWRTTRDETGAIFDSSFAFIPTLTVDASLNNDKWLDVVRRIIAEGAPFVFA